MGVKRVNIAASDTVVPLARWPEVTLPWIVVLTRGLDVVLRIDALLRVCGLVTTVFALPRWLLINLRSSHKMSGGLTCMLGFVVAVRSW
jgi:hypothetical protein